MINKLELKHLAPYLPYGLKMVDTNNNDFINELKPTNIDLVNEYDKPILRPLSDLEKEIEFNGQKIIPFIELLKHSCFDTDNMDDKRLDSFKDSFKESDFICLHELHLYLQWHFDVFGLIEKGLAIDINTLDFENKSNLF